MRKYSSTIPPLALSATLSAGATTATITNGSSIPVIASPDTLTLVIAPDTVNEEIVTVTAHSSGSATITIVRAQESTTDRTHASGIAVKHMVTARDLQEPHVHINATNYTENSSASLHGIGSGEGNVVGTAKTQTLTNKTINSDNNTITVTQARVTGLTDALNAKAPLASPALTGTPTAPTAAIETNSTQVATTAFVKLVTNTKQDSDSDLTAIAALSGTGFIARTADGTAAVRTVVAGTGIAITNGDGVSGDPTVSATIYFSQVAPPANKTNSFTLTAAECLNGIVVASPAGTDISMTVPTGTSIETALPAGTASDTGFRWSAINISTNRVVTFAANTNHTYVGSTNIAINTSASFITRKTATNTFVTYRVA
jgi:hypothetical protein